MKLLILLSAMALASCGSICAPAKLPLPPENVYPKIEATELVCVSDSTYKKLNTRRAMCESRVKTLRNTIKSTH